MPPLLLFSSAFEFLKRLKRKERKKKQKANPYPSSTQERKEEKEMRVRGYVELMRAGREGGRSNEEGFDEDDFM